MNFRFTIVERSLNRAEFRWKWLKFLRYSFLLGGIGCLVLMGITGTIFAGWLTNKALAIGIIVCAAVIGLIVWLVILLAVFAGKTDRNWLAKSLERVDN